MLGVYFSLLIRCFDKIYFNYLKKNNYIDMKNDWTKNTRYKSYLKKKIKNIQNSLDILNSEINICSKKYYITILKIVFFKNHALKCFQISLLKETISW